MSAYNSVNGQFAGENEVLLREILKGDWAFDGFVLSDFSFGTHPLGPSTDSISRCRRRTSFGAF